MISRPAWAIAEFSLGYTVSAHSSALSQGSAKSRHPFQQSNSPRRHEKTGPWCHTPDSPLQAPLHRQTSVLRTNDFSNLWPPPTLSFKGGFERTVKSQIISGPTVTLLLAPTLERRTPHRPVCSHYAVQTCAGSLGNNVAHGGIYTARSLTSLRGQFL